MPGKSGAGFSLLRAPVFAESRSLAMRFSRSSSLTLRARRAGVNSLARRAPRVVGSEVAMSKYRCSAGARGFGGNEQLQMRGRGRERLGREAVSPRRRQVRREMTMMEAG